MYIVESSLVLLKILALKEVGSLVRLDFRTRLFLHITKAKIVRYETDVRDVYVFENYESYRNYFKTYVDDVDEDMIKLAVYAIGKKGQIVAFKGLCEKIIASSRN